MIWNNVIENTDSYDSDIKNMMNSGLDEIDERVDISEFLKSVVEQKQNIHSSENMLFNDQINWEDAKTSEDSKSQDSTNNERINNIN